MENDDYLSRFDKFYSSHGTTAPFSEIRGLEVEDRENYTDEEFDNWMSKYNISTDTRMIWLTPSKGVALSYYGPPTYDEDWEGWKDPRWGFRMPLQHIEEMMGWDDELAQQFIDEYFDSEEYGDVLDSFDASNLVLIPESHDGDDGFLAMV